MLSNNLRKAGLLRLAGNQRHDFGSRALVASIGTAQASVPPKFLVISWFEEFAGLVTTECVTEVKTGLKHKSANYL